MNQQYNEMFTSFQTNKIQVEQFEIYLKQKCGHFYDEHIFSQLIELSLNNGLIDLETFINQFNDTVDTLQFRSDVISNKIKELKGLHQQLSDQLSSDALQQNSLTIQIMECANIELKDPSVYIQICCGAKTHKTRILKGFSPLFQEQFEFPIDERSQDVIITLFDSATDNMIGYTQFQLQELREQKLKDLSVNLQRQDNMKIKTKLHVILKYNHSKESLYKQEQQKLNHEININNIEMKETQQALICLSKVFSGGCIKIRQLPPLLEIKDFELRYLENLNDALNERIKDWVPLFYKLTGLVVALSVMISLYRSQFLEITLLGFMILLLVLREINQKWMRVFTYLFAVLFLYDIFWLYICGGVSVGITKGEQHMNKFVSALTIIELIAKIPFTIVLWKHSIEFEQFFSYFI